MNHSFSGWRCWGGLMLAASSLCFGAGTGSVTVGLSSTPAALLCSGTQYANRVTVKPIPGNVGPIFVGKSSLNVGTLANVAAILAPNPGAHSEEYTITDPTSNDGINLCNLYVAGTSGDVALIDYSYATGSSGADSFELLFAGPVGSTSGPYGDPINSSAVRFSAFRVQSIPGNTGNARLWHASNITLNPWIDYITLAANGSNSAKHSGFSDTYEALSNVNSYSDQGGLISNGGAWGIQTSVGGEKLLVSEWQHVHAGSPTTPVGSTGITLGHGGVYVTPAVNFSTFFNTVQDVQFRTTDAAWAKVLVGENGLNGGTAHSAAHLWPSGAASPSEGIHLGNGCVWNSNGSYLQSSASSQPFEWSVQEVGSTGRPGCPYAASVTDVADTISPSTSTPTVIGRGSVQGLTIRVTPGQSGKMYVGNSSMNKSTLAGVYAILYPNGGAWSEEFSLSDPSGDGIDTNSIYLLADAASENVLISTVTTGITPASTLTLSGGKLTHGGSAVGDLVNSSSLPATVFRVQVIPGQTGKIRLGTSAMTATQWDSTFSNEVKVLWPNSGNYAVGEGQSEKFQRSCLDGSNCLDLASYRWFPEVSGENILIFSASR